MPSKSPSFVEKESIAEGPTAKVRVDGDNGTDCDVLIVGAGPTGLTLANFLGMYGVSAIIIDRNDGLIDYPRGVSLDDESLRVFQTIGLVERVREHIASDQWIRYVTPRGRCFASVEPRSREFGWPRRNAFVQPLVDRVLLEGLGRYGMDVLFGHSLTTFEQDEVRVVATIQNAQGQTRQINSKFIVGSDGGRSTVRKVLGVAFEGDTDSTRWLVIDINNDPLGIPDAYLFCDPARPIVSMALPHGLRRFEFMVFENETDEEVSSPEGMQKLLSLILPNPGMADIIRGRVYTHHARIARSFTKERALLAGDAAHLMPVWQGQGFNSGIRDASNIAWKLAAITKGLAGRSLVTTYDAERREHAKAMIALSVFVGRIFSPTNRWLARLRDIATYLLGAVPTIKSYILQMRFKPMPRYLSGAVVQNRSSWKMTAPSAVGRMIAQPMVTTLDGRAMLFDDAAGSWFAIVSWVIDPRHYMDAEAREFWDRMGARFVSIIPDTQAAELSRQNASTDRLILIDKNLEFKEWFGRHQVSTVILRSDRFVAGAVTATEISDATRKFRAACFASDSPDLVRPGSSTECSLTHHAAVL